jgi:hypothetical protein
MLMKNNVRKKRRLRGWRTAEQRNRKIELNKCLRQNKESGDKINPNMCS